MFLVLMYSKSDVPWDRENFSFFYWVPYILYEYLAGPKISYSNSRIPFADPKIFT